LKWKQPFIEGWREIFKEKMGKLHHSSRDLKRFLEPLLVFRVPQSAKALYEQRAGAERREKLALFKRL
jgi:hypothetical protein